MFGCKYGLYTWMNREIKFRKDVLRVTGRVNIVTKLIAEGERAWDLERILVCIDVWTSYSEYVYTTLSPIIPLSHECPFRYSPNQDAPCPCFSLYTPENAPLVKRLQFALWMIFNNRKM